MIHRIYAHVVWTTRNREPLIDVRLAAFLRAFFRGVAGQERTRVLEIGFVTTHVHLLVRTHPTTNLSRLLQRLKGGSAAIAGKERRSAPGRELRWAKGYSFHSVSARNLDVVRQYIRAQPLHHPNEAIAGWADEPEYEDEWRSEGRRGLRTP